MQWEIWGLHTSVNEDSRLLGCYEARLIFSDVLGKHMHDPEDEGISPVAFNALVWTTGQQGCTSCVLG